MVAAVELPSLALERNSSFELETFEVGGQNNVLGQVAEVADPRWTFEYDLAGPPSLKDRLLLQSFLDRVRLRRTPVLCYDTNRRVPFSYYDDGEKPLAAGAPWGAPQIVDYSRSDSSFVLAGWTPGLKLHAGDYFSFQDVAGIWHLHRLTDSATTSPAGVVTVSVAPRPARGLNHANALLRVRDACCQAVLQYNPRDLSYGLEGGGGLRLRGFEMKRAFI